MSMINRMLKDLDKRHGLDGEAQVVTDGVSLSFRKTPSRLPWVFGVLLLVALAIAVYFVFRNRQSVPPAQSAPAAPLLAQAPVAASPVGAGAPSAVASETASAPANVVAQAASGSANPQTPSAASEQGAKPESAVSKPTEAGRTAVAVTTPTPKPVAPVVVPVSSAQATAAPVKPSAPKPVAQTTSAAQPSSTAQTQPSGEVAKPAAGDAGKVKPTSGEVMERPAPIKFVSRQQRSQNAFNRAVGMLQQGRDAEAQAALEEALSADPRHVEARQLLSTVWVQTGRIPEATGMLLEGLRGAPTHAGLRLTLARIHVAHGRNAEALATLERLPMADSLDGEYHALLAGLYQSGKRHADAVRHFLAALADDPGNPQWLIGAGISLRATGQVRTAAEAFQRALDSGALAPEVAQFALQQLKQLGAAK